jgi:hypothetical protein
MQLELLPTPKIRSPVNDRTPAQEFECRYYPPNLAQIAAIALENQNRKLGI